jgi:hypothetical protein
MTGVTGGGASIGFVTLVAAILTAGLCGDAIAKVHKGRLHVRSATSESRAQLISKQPVWLGPMRYYGGPKYPMWRGPVEN